MSNRGQIKIEYPEQQLEYGNIVALDLKGEFVCQFCGKAHNQVKKMFVSKGASICDECVELCNTYIETERCFEEK